MLGEIRENNKGTKMIIIAQRGCDDIAVSYTHLTLPTT